MAKPLRVLFLSANPEGTTELRVIEEYKQIDSRIQASEFREQFKLEQSHAVTLMELQSLLLRFKPNMVHFSGHGSEKGALVFEDYDGQAEEANPKALTALFKIINEAASSEESEDNHIRCVVLNACYSHKQAKAIAQHVDCVIGMSDAIKDASAINFAASFYQALGYGKSVQTAFDLGRVQLGLFADADEGILKLECKKDVEPSKVFFLKRGDTGSEESRKRLSLHCTKILQEVPIAETYFGLPFFEMNSESTTMKWPYFKQLLQHIFTGHNDVFEAMLEYRKTHPRHGSLTDSIAAYLFSLFKQASVHAPNKYVLSSMASTILRLRQKTSWDKFRWKREGTEFVIEWEDGWFNFGDMHVDDVTAENICSILNDFFFKENKMTRLHHLWDGAGPASMRYEQKIQALNAELNTDIRTLGGACDSCIAANLHDESASARYRQALGKLPEEWERATPRL